MTSPIDGSSPKIPQGIRSTERSKVNTEDLKRASNICERILSRPEQAMELKETFNKHCLPLSRLLGSSKDEKALSKKIKEVSALLQPIKKNDLPPKHPNPPTGKTKPYDNPLPPKKLDD